MTQINGSPRGEQERLLIASRSVEKQEQLCTVPLGWQPRSKAADKSKRKDLKPDQSQAKRSHNSAGFLRHGRNEVLEEASANVPDLCSADLEGTQHAQRSCDWDLGMHAAFHCRELGMVGRVCNLDSLLLSLCRVEGQQRPMWGPGRKVRISRGRLIWRSLERSRSKSKG